MASDQERREVADQLRREAAYREGSTLGEWWACLQSVACGCDDFPDPRTLFDCLADLIDRPTCRNLAEEPEDFRCSACGGMKFDIFAARYCPDCGAEIIVS